MNESNNPSALRSQTEITEALISLMHKYPYNEISVKQIILEARLARKTFYRNFASKDDVLMSLIRRILREYFETVSYEKGNMLPTVFSVADKHRDLLMLLDKNDMLYVTLTCFNEYLPVLRSQRLSELDHSIKAFGGADPMYLMALNSGAVWNVLALWIHRGMTDPPESVRKTLESYLQRIMRPAGSAQVRPEDGKK